MIKGDPANNERQIKTPGFLDCDTLFDTKRATEDSIYYYVYFQMQLLRLQLLRKQTFDFHNYYESFRITPDCGDLRCWPCKQSIIVPG